jgi:uncharacterized protein (TIGR02300 family)|tara:strand:+ start:239 stop:643 length:405 start_codon:yes stop_codon:yes gene_type:complete
MAKPEWGKKRICTYCNTKYYDLNKSPIICPSCGAEFNPNDYLKSKKGKNVPLKASVEDDNDLTKDIENIDDIEIDNDSEVVSDDDPLLEINKEDQNVIADDEIDMDEDVSFIDDDEITEDDNGINVEINEDDKS